MLPSSAVSEPGINVTLLPSSGPIRDKEDKNEIRVDGTLAGYICFKESI